MNVEDQTNTDVTTEQPASPDELKSFLEDRGFDSLEELEGELVTVKGIKEKLGDSDLDEILADAEMKRKWEESAALEEAKKLEDDEEPEETIARLKREKDELVEKTKNEELTKAEMKAAQEAIEGFNDTINTVLEKEEIPKEVLPYVQQFLGVDNPANAVDISKKSEVKKMASKGIKSFRALEQAIIKNYRDGKTDTPPMGPSGDAANDPPAKPKTIKEAGNAYLEKVLASNK